MWIEKKEGGELHKRNTGDGRKGGSLEIPISYRTIAIMGKKMCLSSIWNLSLSSRVMILTTGELITVITSINQICHSKI